MSGFTKEIIIRTLFELLNEKPLAKITVKDIVERCGVNRNTFYYHFRDISDVVESVFSSLLPITCFLLFSAGLVTVNRRFYSFW